MRLKVSETRTPTPTLPLVEGGGEILLAEQRVYLPQGRPIWQIGELRLTGERLLFLQPRGVIFDTPLTLITEVATESKRFTHLSGSGCKWNYGGIQGLSYRPGI